MRKKISLVASLAFAAALCAGVGAADVTAQAETDWATFTITDASVRLGVADSATNPTGLRFKVNCPDVLKDTEGAEHYTVLSFTSSVLGEAQEYNLKVPASVWREDGSGWNAVLLGIPVGDYVTEVTAVSYVEVNGEVVHQTAPATTSIAKTASKVLAGGAVDAQLDAFVANAVSAISLGENDGQSIEAEVGETVQLTATTTPAGYSVMWSSSDDSVATVDNNGKVTVTGAGKAKINAVMGGAGTVCEIVSTWGEKYGFEGDTTASPLANVQGGQNWNVATLEGGNQALAVYEDAEVSMFKFQFNTDYLSWVFENHDFFSWTIYSDMPYVRYLQENIDISYNVMYGYHNNGAFFMEGTPVDGGLYAFYFTYSKDNWENMQALGDGFSHHMRVAFSATGAADAAEYAHASKVYFDDIIVGDYTLDTITFEDGYAHGAIPGGTTSANVSTNLVKTTDGYAMKMQAQVNSNSIKISQSYLHYIFNENDAAYLEFKVYPLDLAATVVNYAGFAANKDAYSGSGSYLTYVADGGYFLARLPKALYEKHFDENGAYKANSISGYATLTDLYLNVWYKASGYSQGGYVDDIRPVLTTPTNSINFEDGDNWFIGVDPNAKWTLNGIVTHEGDKALKFTMGSNAGGFSISHEYLHWAFYENNAESITFTVSAETDITTVSRMHEATIAWYGSAGAFDIWQWGMCTTEIVDGNVKVTLPAALYKISFAEDGTFLRNASGAVSGTPYYFGIRVTLSDANGTLGSGTVVYLDDFVVNYAA